MLYYIVGFNAGFLRKHEKGKNSDMKHVFEIIEIKIMYKLVFIFYFRSSDKKEHTHVYKSKFNPCYVSLFLYFFLIFLFFRVQYITIFYYVINSVFILCFYFRLSM